MAGSLFRTKSIDRLLADARAPEPGPQTADIVAASAGEHTLKRTLGPWSLVSLGIGGIIGAGIFVRTAAASCVGECVENPITASGPRSCRASAGGRSSWPT